MTFETWFRTQCPGIELRSAQAVIKLTEEGATLPFIARYRKEQTGNLDEVLIQAVLDAKALWDSVLKRKEFVLKEIESQGKLTDSLKGQILEAFTLEKLEDLYLPYKQKRKTKATKAKEAGLEPLADWIWSVGHGESVAQVGETLAAKAAAFINVGAAIGDADTAVAGASDILIERLAERADLRESVRAYLFKQARIQTEKGEKAQAHSKFEMYFAYSESVASLLDPKNTHRYLAIRRGWTEEELKLSIIGAEEGDLGFEKSLLPLFEGAACSVRDSVAAPVLLKVAKMAFKAYVLPSIESEVHTQLKAKADESAIKVFSENVKKLLLASPFGPKAVMGVDPGVRTGCKVAIVDDAGKFVANFVMNLQTDHEREMAQQGLAPLIQNGKIRAIAVGNGTAGRETEAFLRKALKESGLDTPVVMVSEAGASVYSASEVARTEFPDLDVTVRGAISIARRLQDPLAELVKTDPKSIGVGQYQHDVSQPALKKSLDLVVDVCVNSVGVNLNTASSHLLAHVSGIGEGLARSIVDFRSKHGLFKSRSQLLSVPRFSQKVFEQAAGFLRVQGSDNPLDNTGVHPERYGVLEKFAESHAMSLKDLIGPQGVESLRKDAELRAQLGEFTFEDIVREIEKPGRDPRESFVPFQFREGVMELAHLKVGEIYPGIVTNVTTFGVFVDVGVHQDGLVHISQLSQQFVSDPGQMFSPGDHVKAKVLAVNLEKKQISLSFRLEDKPERSAAPTESRAPRAARPTRSQQQQQAQPQRNAGPRPEVRKPTPTEPRKPLQPSGRPPMVSAPQPKKPLQPSAPFNNPFAQLAGKFKK